MAAKSSYENCLLIITQVFTHFMAWKHLPLCAYGNWFMQ